MEFDHRGEASRHQSIMMLAYGERVDPSERYSFEPVIARAEHRARCHRDLLIGKAGTTHRPLHVLRREWFLVRETNLASVQNFEV